MAGYSQPTVEGGRVRSYDGTFDFDDLRLTWKRIRLTAPADGNETDTGVDLPSDAVVLGVMLNVITAEATGTTKTIDVGLLSSETNGDADGFLDGVSVSATGWVKGTLLSTGQTLGALLHVDESGAGVLVPEPHIIDEAVSVTYTAASADFAELVADLYIQMIQVEDL